MSVPKMMSLTYFYRDYNREKKPISGLEFISFPVIDNCFKISSIKQKSRSSNETCKKLIGQEQEDLLFMQLCWPPFWLS